jgi:hypothetical protein
MNPDHKIVIEHIESGEFQIGVEENKWDIINFDKEILNWPNAFIWVNAAKKQGLPDKYYFNFDLSNYPEQAPTARPWDIESNQPLETTKWPKGGRVSFVFNPGWRTFALYAPCDREAMKGHESWKEKHPNLWWRSDFKITIYLEFLYGLLNSFDYENT